MAEALAAFGLVAEPADIAAAADAGEDFVLWPEHQRAFGLWLDVQTQWRSAGMGGVRTGLDYAGVEALLRVRHRCRRTQARLFSALQIMERAALDAWATMPAAR